MNDAQYERVQEMYDEIIDQAEGEIQSDSVNIYGVDGGNFGIEILFGDEVYQVVGDYVIGDADSTIAFAEELGGFLTQNSEEFGVGREQPFIIDEFTKLWVA